MSALAMARPRRPGARPWIRIRALQVAAIAGLLGIWAGLSGSGAVAPLILPPPWVVAEELSLLVQEPALWNATLITTTELVTAFALSAVTGVLAGFLLSRRQRVARVVEPILAWGYVFPFALLYPLFVLWLGAGQESKVAYAFANAVFPIAMNTMRGLSAVDERYMRVGEAFRASSRQIDWHIKLGGAWPMILSGLRIGGGMVMVAVVLGEVLGANGGLGFEIQQAVNTFQIAKSYALICFLILLSSLLLLIMERALRTNRHA